MCTAPNSPHARIRTLITPASPPTQHHHPHNIITPPHILPHTSSSPTHHHHPHTLPTHPPPPTRDAGAVASARAAELYGMNILDTDIQDMEANITRFLVLSRDPYVITDPNTCYKTSIVFSLQEGPGNLFKVWYCVSVIVYV